VARIDRVVELPATVRPPAARGLGGVCGATDGGGGPPNGSVRRGDGP